MRSEKALLLARFDYTEDAEMKQAKAWAERKEKNIDDLFPKENRCEEELDAALTEFQTLTHKAETYDPDTLWPERLNLRETMSQETEDQLKAHFGRSFSYRRLHSAEADVRLYLEDDEESLRRYVDRKRQRIREEELHKPNKREQER